MFLPLPTVLDFHIIQQYKSVSKILSALKFDIPW